MNSDHLSEILYRESIPFIRHTIWKLGIKKIWEILLLIYSEDDEIKIIAKYANFLLVRNLINENELRIYFTPDKLELINEISKNNKKKNTMISFGAYNSFSKDEIFFYSNDSILPKFADDFNVDKKSMKNRVESNFKNKFHEKNFSFSEF